MYNLINYTCCYIYIVLYHVFIYIYKYPLTCASCHGWIYNVYILININNEPKYTFSFFFIGVSQ